MSPLRRALARCGSGPEEPHPDPCNALEARNADMRHHSHGDVRCGARARRRRGACYADHAMEQWARRPSSAAAELGGLPRVPFGRWFCFGVSAGGGGRACRWPFPRPWNPRPGRGREPLRRRGPARFGGGVGVGVASVGRRRALERTQGEPRPGPLGGDRRSGRIEAQGPLIRRLLEEALGVALEERCCVLGERGRGFGHGTLRRFLGRHGITRKKRRAMRASRTARTS